MDTGETSLQSAASVFVEQLLNLTEGERLLLYVDEGSDPRVAQAVQSCAQRITSQTELYDLGPALPLSQMLDGLTRKIEQGGFDVICELSEQYFYPTVAWQRAVQLGGRIYALGPLDADAFIRCVGRVDHALMFRFGLALRSMLRAASSVRLVSGQGTDIHFSMTKGGVLRRALCRLGLRQRPWLAVPSGIFAGGRNSTFLGGQLALQGLVETVEGTAVIDGYLWPPAQIGRLDEPIVLELKRGRVVDIHGPSSEAQVLRHWLHRRDMRVKHVCFGFHPGAGLTGSMTEAERVLGGISVGIGTYPFHTDGLIKTPSVWFDGTLIEQDGIFVAEGLSDLARDLIQEYYGPGGAGRCAPGGPPERPQ